MGLMQWDTTQPERQPQYILGFHILSTGFKYHWCKVLETQFEVQLNWNVLLLCLW